MRAVQMCVCVCVWGAGTAAVPAPEGNRGLSRGCFVCVCISYGNIFWAITAGSLLLSSLNAYKCFHDTQQKPILVILSALQDNIFVPHSEIFLFNITLILLLMLSKIFCPAVAAASFSQWNNLWLLRASFSATSNISNTFYHDFVDHPYHLASEIMLSSGLNPSSFLYFLQEDQHNPRKL